MLKEPLAIVTMAHNEADMLPIWLRHYGRQVGIENCYILDHASTDGSTRDVAGARLIRLPPSRFDDNDRARLISDFCASLLRHFEFVTYTDCDEMLVADPIRHHGLVDLVRASPHDVLTCFGMDLIHMDFEEKPLDTSRPILSQRHWVRPTSGGCKPLITRRPLNWGVGFHFADTATHFGDLLNFHLAYCDFGMIARRQAERAATMKAEALSGSHHNWTPETMVTHIRNDYTTLPRVGDADLAVEAPIRQAFTQRMFDRGEMFGGEPMMNHGTQSEVLWRVPARFQDRL